MLVAGCAPNPEIWVSITGPPSADWPPQRIVVELGDEAWILEPGLRDAVVMVSSSSTLPGRLLWADDCSQIATFTGEPNGRYEVLFSADGTATIRQVEATSMGPGLGESRASPC